MSKLLWAAAGVSALAIAAPAAGQSGYGQGQYSQSQYSRGAGFEARFERLEARLRAGVQQRSISNDEARLLDAQLRRLRDMHRRYAADGLSREERRDLQQQTWELRRQMRIADSGGWDRYDSDDAWRDDDDDRRPSQGYGQRDWIDRDNDGYDDRDYDRDGRWDDDVNARIDRDRDGYDDRDLDRDGRWDDDVNARIDRDRDGFDDRDFNRNGRWDDDLNVRIDRDRDGFDDRDYDRDGRWDDDVAEGRSIPTPPAAAPVEDRGIVGALLDTFLGGATPTLRVGDRAPDNLYGVPTQYQAQFRDRYDVYFRSDGRAIYEIDARNRTVVRVHPMR